MDIISQSRKDMNLRCRRIVYRCWRRGMREMDLILGSFVDEFILDLSESELDMIEDIIKEDDSNLFKWFMGIEKVPEYLNTSLFQKIADYYSFNIVKNSTMGNLQ